MKEEEYFNQRVDCVVKECKYKDCASAHCTLGKICVGGTKCKNETFCNNFEKKES